MMSVTLSFKEDFMTKAEEARKLKMEGLKDRADRELESRKTHVQSASAARAEQPGRRAGAERVEGHVGAQTRRRQAKRDTKNG